MSKQSDLLSAALPFPDLMRLRASLPTLLMLMRVYFGRIAGN
jgi:hypothetical protein